MHQKDMKERANDCTDHNEMAWIMQGTDWSHYRVKGTKMGDWLNKMEDLADGVEDLYGVQLMWQRGRNKHMFMEELLCPVINNITSEVKVSVNNFYKHKQQTDPDTDYESNSERVECCRVDGRTIPRVWTQPRVRDHKGNGDNMIRLLMWNPENLAQRLDLDGAVSKGKQTRMNSPPLGTQDQYERSGHTRSEQ